MRTTAFDIRLALRSLARDWPFAVAGVAMLSVALALNTTIFAVMDAMLFRGYPHVAGNDRLLYVQERDAAGRCCIAYTDFEAWRAQARSFEGMGYVGSYNPIALGTGGLRPADLNAISITANTFGLLGVRPFLGRDFSSADERPGAPQVVILNHRLWRSTFGGRMDVVGTEVEINGAPVTIVGVMPEGFDFPTRESAWIPLAPTAALQQRGLTPGFMVVARLRDETTREQATAELQAINRQLAAAYRETNQGMVPTVASHAETMSGQHASLIWGSLWVAASLVLLVACAGLANLNLVRTIGRQREFQIKLALGSGRARLVRQLVCESTALAAAAVPIAWWATNWAVERWAVATASRYQILNYAVDGQTLAYLAAASLAAAVVMSLAPCVRLLHAGGAHTLALPSRGEATDPRARRLAAALVAGQMALATVLLSSAGLLVRSFSAIVGAASGVRDPDSVLTASVRLPSVGYASAESRRQFFDRLRAALDTVPGVAHASLATTIPVRYALPRAFEVEGHVRTDHDPPLSAVSVEPGYFDVIGAAVVAGRAFDAHDEATGQLVAVVNESFAKQYSPEGDSIGRRIRVMDRGQAGPWRVVVGVVTNVMQADPLRQQFKPVVYLPFAQDAMPLGAWFLARTRVPPTQLVAALEGAVLTLEPDAALANAGSLSQRFAFDRDLMDAEHSELGKHAMVTPALALIALLLAAGGLAAVLLHTVGQRTREIGVRMAVGATVSDVRRLILRDGMRPVSGGVAVGLAASLAIGRVMQAELVGVSPHDPLTFGGATLVLAAVALVACLLPATRAARVDPSIALRHE